MNLKIRKYESQNRPGMIELWERSVRATHTFLAKDDIDFYKQQVDLIDFTSFNTFCVFDETENLVGIFGIEANQLVMLFLAPSAIGKGVGKFAMEFALSQFNVTEVEVNEQNADAVNFYKSFGFTVRDRRPLDDMGKPYPILKMRLTQVT